MPTAREQMQKAVDAGHPDNALVGVPVGVLRAILRALPADALKGAHAAPVVPA